MTVFKSFLRILGRNKGIIITYSAILVVFSIFSLRSNETSINFEATRPDIYIINHDDGDGITQTLIDYLAARCEIVALDDSPESLDDALFYRQVNYILEIPSGFHENFWGQTPNSPAPVLEFRSTGDYNASLAENYVERFLELAAAYPAAAQDTEAMEQLEAVLNSEVSVQLTTHLDTNALSRAAFYYNFLNYPLLAGCIFMICLTILSFREHKITQRIQVSSTDPKRLNRELLIANSIYAAVLWAVYVLLSFIVVGKAMFSLQGLGLILNSLIFAGCVTTLAFFLANLAHSRNSINGLVNVIGLGSSFLCGAFVPVSWLPESVRFIAHVLPSYWYIDANEKIVALEELTWGNLWPILINAAVVLAFTAGFIVLTNVAARLHRR